MSITIRKGRFYRVLYFDTEGKLASLRDDWQVTLLVSSPGCPNWRTRWDSSRFKWGVAQPKKHLSPRWRVTTPAKQIEYEVGEMLADPASDCAFSWRWAHLSKREQICLLFDTNARVLDECEVILRSALWTDSTWKDVPDCQWFIRFRDDKTSPSLTVNMGIGGLSGEILSNDTSFPLSSRLFQLLELALRIHGLRFTPQPNDKTAMGRYGVTYWRIYALIPTQHERLEAQLHLRDWLQGKVPDEEIPFLLGEAA